MKQPHRYTSTLPRSAFALTGALVLDGAGDRVPSPELTGRCGEISQRLGRNGHNEFCFCDFSLTRITTNKATSSLE